MKREMHKWTFGLLVMVFALMGCEPVTTIVVKTDAPPGRDARIDQDEEVVRISKDVAVAMECTWYDPWAEDGRPHKPCDDMEIVAEDGDLIEVLPAYLNGSVYAGGYGAYDVGVDPDGLDRAVAVLVGLKAGETTLRVAHSEASFTFNLEVNAFSPAEDVSSAGMESTESGDGGE
jgi:hypothetical protein